MDYFTKTYMVNRPYSSQKSFMRARPQTNVKLMTTNRSQVNYLNTPQGTLRKPYQHDTYSEMPYLFSGYPAVRRNWFDSKVGGQGSKEKAYATKPVMPFGAMYRRDADATWTSARDSADAEFIYLESNQQLNCTSKVEGDPAEYSCQRLFLGFDLRNIAFDEINSCYFGCYAAYPSSYTYTSISIQESTHNPFLYPSDLSVFSKFKGSPFAIKRFTSGWNLFQFNRSGVKYIKKKFGYIAGLCLREYDYDFKNVTPVGASTYTNSIFVATIRLFINHKGKIVILKPTATTEDSGGGQRLIPA